MNSGQRRGSFDNSANEIYHSVADYGQTHAMNQQQPVYDQPDAVAYRAGSTPSPTVSTSDGNVHGPYSKNYPMAGPEQYAMGYGRRQTMSHNPYGDGAMYGVSGFYQNPHPDSGLTAAGDVDVDGKERAGSETGMLQDKQPLSKRQRRKCCGNGMYCFCCSRKCCCIFLPILAVVLVALGITLFFVFPRIPEVTFSGVSVPSNESPATANAKDNSLSQLSSSVSINRKGVVTVPLIIHLDVTNPNYIPWTIHNVTVDGLLRNTTSGGTDFPLGDGGLKVPFKMPKKSVGNDMPIWFNFRLDTNNTNYLDAAVIVQNACTAGGPPLRFHYKAKVILRAISWLGIKPVISDTINFACPIKEIENLGINISDLTGLIGG
ncbi:hypothetical protein GGI07_004452 [Coemansia sp. Benny D115]|nr:hypothetical protein GGI07_004452 [Coemansia sp. Benny D115]